MSPNKITTCLWFDSQAEEAAKNYVSVFPNSEITNISHYTSVGQEHHKKEPGSVMIVSFTLNGHPFVALNGGPLYFHTAATSFMIHCADQAEVDHYWNKLGEGGDEQKQACGWLADKWGVSWQIIPDQFMEYMKDKDGEKVKRVLAAMMNMTKMDIEGLKKAYEGEE
ncbi:putative 3-demethylubiquinone-9 3-methyltransferase [Trematosphaeria pertusa]|uniref:Putative 3-demethylubiquinone-9 3-methyltransferase n=1 Tax=Trematosphaeria pertusa TaxID=390896 RepID=A0A6A6IH24_9PLEO|nr:putative 3-demethylubiquinone-9 3-methyltransferase [Trematosphaeria pertusa]KAF2249338.1 putative 3-demethylubiquinone-9 3-methyltransferase [Trematosphaeria pertusa]